MSQSAPRSHDAFVSYASQDVVVANEIVAALERHRLSCWIAPRDVTPGALYADEIISAINDAKVVVLVLSQHAVSSPHVGKEIERASAKRRPIVTLRVDATPLTRALEYFLSESQWIDLGPEGVAAQAPKLVDAVRRLSQGGVPPVAGAVSAAAPVARSARRLGWPLVAAGVAVVALGAYIMIEKAGVRPALTRSSSDEGAAAPTAAGGTQTVPAARRRSRQRARLSRRRRTRSRCCRS